MSSFLVSDKTIDIVTTLISDTFRYASYPLNKMSVKAVSDLGYDLNDDEAVKKLANDLVNLNLLALKSRYDYKDDKIANHNYSYKPTTLAQAYKSLQCLKYQCSEGLVPLTPLYMALERVCNNLAHALVSQIDEYKSAVWDIE